MLIFHSNVDSSVSLKKTPKSVYVLSDHFAMIHVHVVRDVWVFPESLGVLYFSSSVEWAPGPLLINLKAQWTVTSTFLKIIGWPHPLMLSHFNALWQNDNYDWFLHNHDIVCCVCISIEIYCHIHINTLLLMETDNRQIFQKSKLHFLI